MHTNAHTYLVTYAQIAYLHTYAQIAYSHITHNMRTQSKLKVSQGKKTVLKFGLAKNRNSVQKQMWGRVRWLPENIIKSPVEKI